MTENVYLLCTNTKTMNNDVIYKIGGTGKNDVMKRMNGYSKRCTLLYSEKVSNFRQVEAIIISEFKQKYTLIEHSKEYFTGDIDDMLITIKNIVDKYNNDCQIECLKEEVKLLNKSQQELINKNSELMKTITSLEKSLELDPLNMIWKWFDDYHKNALPIKGIDKLTDFKSLHTFDKDNIGMSLEFMLIHHYNKKTLPKLLCNYILQFYKKKNPLEQSVWCVTLGNHLHWFTKEKEDFMPHIVDQWNKCIEFNIANNVDEMDKKNEIYRGLIADWKSKSVDGWVSGSNDFVIELMIRPLMKYINTYLSNLNKYNKKKSNNQELIEIIEETDEYGTLYREIYNCLGPLFSITPLEIYMG